MVKKENKNKKLKKIPFLKLRKINIFLINNREENFEWRNKIKKMKVKKRT